MTKESPLFAPVPHLHKLICIECIAIHVLKNSVPFHVEHSNKLTLVLRNGVWLYHLFMHATLLYMQSLKIGTIGVNYHLA